eukprot:12374-Heterococcus_DN1.PRE.7
MPAESSQSMLSVKQQQHTVQRTTARVAAAAQGSRSINEQSETLILQRVCQVLTVGGRLCSTCTRDLQYLCDTLIVYTAEVLTAVHTHELTSPLAVSVSTLLTSSLRDCSLSLVKLTMLSLKSVAYTTACGTDCGHAYAVQYKHACEYIQSQCAAWALEVASLHAYNMETVSLYLSANIADHCLLLINECRVAHGSMRCI